MPKRADVIERVRVGRVRLHDLESDDGLVGLAHGDLPDAALGKVDDVVALGLDAERRVERGVEPGLDDRVQHPHEPFGVRGLDVANRQLHARRPLSGAGRRIRWGRV